MSKKIEIIGQALVITDTNTSNVLFEAPKGEYYYSVKELVDNGKIKFHNLDHEDNASARPLTINLSDAVDTDDNPFTLSSFQTFARENLGFKIGGGNGQGVTQEELNQEVASLESADSDLQTQINGLASANPNDVFYARRSEFLDEGANLYNKNDPDNDNNGWLNANNVPQPHATATHSKYFPLTEGQDYWYLNAYGASTSFVIVDSSFVKTRNISGTVNGTFTAQAGESYVRFSVRDVDTFMFAKGSVVGTYEPYLFRIKPDVIDDNIFKDKGIVTFGDSITWFSTGWVYEFNNMLKPQYIDNMAVSGQRIAWNANTVDTGTAPPNDSGDNNVLWNSIKGWEATNVNGDPDIIIIAIGTNDISQGSTIGSFADAYAQDEASTSQLTMANAFRKALHYLRTNYPDTQIFYSTPIQSKTGGRNYDTIKEVRDVNSQIAERFGVKIIDSTFGSGISDEFENASAVGRYLYDGTHPSYLGNQATTDGNELGSVLMAKYITHEIKRLYVE